MFQTFAFYSTAFYREFSAYTARVLQGIGLNYGALFPLIYVGKHPGCTPSQLVHALGLDWGYGQRSIQKLVDDGFISVSYTHLDVYKRQICSFAANITRIYCP